MADPNEGSVILFRSIFLPALAVAFFLPISPSGAALLGELEACSKVQDVTKRAACYDVLTAKYKDIQPADLLNPNTKWHVSTHVSPITDTSDVYMHRNSRKTVQTDIFGEAHPMLLIQCVNGQTSIAVNWEFIVGGGTLPLTYRVDDAQPVTAEVKVSDDFRSIVSWSSERSIEVIKTLLGKEKVALQITPLSQQPVAVVFDLEGLEKAVQPLRKSCNW